MSDRHILSVRGLNYAYSGGVPALRGLDLDVVAGTRLAILGPNGSGKSTLLLHLNGTLRPGSGEVRLDGAPVAMDRRSLGAWRAAVGLAFQDPEDQLFAATVFEDVSFGPLNQGRSEAEARSRVVAALEVMGISDLADRPTHRLSFGQKKRTAIAGLLAMGPRVLLLDEPTAGLDGQGVETLLSVLDGLVAQGTTLVFATHDVDLAYGWADAVAVFHEGRTLRQGRPDEVLADADLIRAASLRTPWMLDMGLAARRNGWLGPTDPLPRTRAEVLALLAKAGGTSSAF